MRVRVGQLHDIFAVIAITLALFRFQDQCTIGAVGFLKSRVAVKPIRSTLHDGKAVREGLTGLDPGIADPRHTVLVKRQDQSVPVDGGVFVQVVGDVDRHLFAFLEPKNRWFGRAIISDTRTREFTGIDLHVVNGQPILAAHRYAGQR